MTIDQRIAAAKKEVEEEKNNIVNAQRRLKTAKATKIAGKILHANTGVQIAIKLCIEAEEKYKKLLQEKIDLIEKRRLELIKKSLLDIY